MAVLCLCCSVGFSLVVEQRLLIVVLLLFWSTSVLGFSGCGSWPLEHRLNSCGTGA